MFPMANTAGGIRPPKWTPLRLQRHLRIWVRSTVDKGSTRPPRHWKTVLCAQGRTLQLLRLLQEEEVKRKTIRRPPQQVEQRRRLGEDKKHWAEVVCQLRKVPKIEHTDQVKYTAVREKVLTLSSTMMNNLGLRQKFSTHLVSIREGRVVRP